MEFERQSIKEDIYLGFIESKRVARRLITTGTLENAVEANECLRDDYQINVANDIVRSCFKSLGIIAKTKIKTSAIRMKRLKFAKDHFLMCITF